LSGRWAAKVICLINFTRKAKVSKFRLSHLAEDNTVVELLVRVNRQTGANCACELPTSYPRDDK